MVDQITASGSRPPSVATAPKPAAARQVSSGPVAQATPEAGGQDAAMTQVNQHLEQGQTDLRLQLDPGSGRTVFQVIQQGTGQVVLQVPSEEVLGMSRRMRELESGQGPSGGLLDKKG